MGTSVSTPPRRSSRRWAPSAIGTSLGSIGRTRIAPPLRFFESDWAEAATRTPWWLVPLVWLPIAAYAAFVGCRLAMDGRTGDLGGFGFGDGSFGDGLFGGVWLRWMCLVLAWVAGYWFWGVLEYAFHRFAFHRAPTSALGITLHFLMHGCHHKAPADACRLVFPPAAAAPVIWFFRRAFRSVIGGYLGAGEAASALFFSGCLTGYVAYDCVHYFLHHWDFDPGTLERAGGGVYRLGHRLGYSEASRGSVDAHGAPLRRQREVVRDHERDVRPCVRHRAARQG